jgi:abhydrolase domain-containing protein 14
MRESLTTFICFFAVTCTCVRGVPDLEAGLRKAYVDKGTVSEHEVSVSGLGVPIHYLQAGPSDARRLVVLLHGMAFNAETWKVVGTLDALADAGLRAVALDCQGYSGQFQKEGTRQRLLHDFLAAIGWQPRERKIVIVAASAGGSVGSPFVLGAGAAEVAGYASVSALLPSDIQLSTTSDVPTLMIWGELDSPNSNKAQAHERIFPSHQKVVLPQAPHPCYLKEPKLFNSLIVQFVTGKAVESNYRVNVVADWKARKDGL